MSDDMLQHVDTSCQSVSKSVKVCQKVSKMFKSCQNWGFGVCRFGTYRYPLFDPQNPLFDPQNPQKRGQKPPFWPKKGSKTSKIGVYTKHYINSYPKIRGQKRCHRHPYEFLKGGPLAGKIVPWPGKLRHSADFCCFLNVFLGWPSKFANFCSSCAQNFANSLWDCATTCHDFVCVCTHFLPKCAHRHTCHDAFVRLLVSVLSDTQQPCHVFTHCVCIDTSCVMTIDCTWAWTTKYVRSDLRRHVVL